MFDPRCYEFFERNRAKGSIKIKTPNKPGKFPDLYPEDKKEASVQQSEGQKATDEDKAEAVELDPEAGLDNQPRPKPEPQAAWNIQMQWAKSEDQAQKVTVPEMLRESASTYEERNALYGDNYKHFGKAMMGVFPNGLTVSDEDGWNKLGVLIQVMSKLTRIGQSFPNVHDDSCLDISVYATMLRELGRGSK